MNPRLLLIALGVMALSSGCAKKPPDSPSALTPEASAADPNATADTSGSADAPAPSGTDTAAPSAQPDAAFFQTAAEGGMAEVEAGRLAQSKASSAGVKSFAAMMVKDHSAANAKLKRIAADNNVTLPTELNPEHEAMHATLSGLSGAAFDKEYIRGQVKDHEATATLLQSEIDSGTNADAKAFATETLPTVQTHLKKVKELASKSGVDAG